MVRICSLYSLENIDASYFITEALEIVDINRNKKIKPWVSVRGYPTVTLRADTNSPRKCRNIPMHRIVALAFIENKPHVLVEHIDDNKLDYRPENLKFGTKSSNGKNAFTTGCQKRPERKYRLELIDGTVYEGTAKELSAQTGITRSILYYSVGREFNTRPNANTRARRNKVKLITEIW